MKRWKKHKRYRSSFTKKNNKTYHWYKGHIETEKTGKFIMNTTFSTAKVHDSSVQEDLMLWEEMELYWDSAYGMNTKRNEFFEELWIQVEFHEKWVRGTPLTPYQKEVNRSKSTIRAKVEHPFSKMKCRYWFYKTRYIWMLKNGMHWFFGCALYNFERIARSYL